MALFALNSDDGPKPIAGAVTTQMSRFLGKKFGPFGATSRESLAEFFCYQIPIGALQLHCSLNLNFDEL